ncbi:uncharacterized protein LOC119667612 isoform X2 [Teleopsis dalmanni]|uniref:uncharacterized protein LOC119667612 isoform X2 n=1 Tax=Teleopsis dalmanni TaxID=139649 RepID=UPI0018CD3915|nr:uncharacterized protein LOC119667612 isoform X2 [Teleopsis dalmanni]
MAQYYIQMDDLKQIYPDVQVVHVDDNAQLVLQDDQILYNEGQVVYQQPNTNNAQYQQQLTTRYILSDDVNQQQQQHAPHQQIMIHQQQQTKTHYQQEQPQPQEQVQPELQMQHTQQQQNQQSPTQQLYYNSDQILQQNSIVHHSPHSQQQQQQNITQQLHISQQQPQQQQVHQQYQQQQQIVHHQQSLQQNSTHQQVQPQTQQVVYRMPAQQQQLPQQTQMLNNTHVIVQPLIQSPHNQEIILRHTIPQQRITYNTTNRVVYSSPAQAQSQTILQQPNQQPHLQLQANPLQQQTRLVQTRVTTQIPAQSAQPQQQQQMQSGVIYQHMQPLSSNQIQKSPIPQPQQQQIVTTQMVTAVRGAIRGKSMRGAGSPSVSARITGISTRGGIRASAPTQGAASQATKSPRSRNSGSGSTRGRGGGRGRGSRNNTIALANTIPGTAMQTQTPQIMQNKITIANVNQTQMKQIYRQQIVDSSGVPHPHLQLISTQRISSIGNPRYRCPTDVGQSQHQPSTSPNGGSSGELDLEDSIQAVIVKKDQQKVIPSAMSTTLTSYYKEDDDNRIARSQNGQSISLTEFKKRNLSVNTTGSINTTKTIMTVRPQINTGTNKISLTGTGQMLPLVPIARVAPQRMSNPQPEPETPIVTGSSVHQTAHNNYEIQTHHVLQNRSSHQMGEKDRNSAKMLVILVSGEQRLITFTLPRESCTVQDLLEQVGVSFDNNTTIQCVENPGANIDFVVTVGFSVQESASELISRAEQSLQLSRQQEAVAIANATNNACATTNNATTSTTSNFHNSLARAVAAAAIADDSTKDSTNSASPSSSTKTSSEEIPRKIIQGFFAICQSCGFSGVDHAKCERCKRVFLEPPKRVPFKSSTSSSDSSHIKNPNDITEKKRGSENSSRGKNYLPFSNSTRGRGGQRGRSSRTSRKAVDAEPVILTLSSDEEADDEPSNTSNKNIGSSLNNSKMITYSQPLSFEPIISESDETAIYTDFKRTDITELSDELDKSCVKLYCKNVRIGGYCFETAEPVNITAKGIQITAPLVNNDKEFCILNIHKHEIVKLIGHFNKPDDVFVLCFYTLRKCAQYIKTSLNIADEPVADGTTYFIATGPYQYRKIILHIDSISDQALNTLKQLCNPLDEIGLVDVQSLLERAADSERQLIALKSNEDIKPQLYGNDIRTLLIYPSGKGGISINTEDYMCLATDQYLNDIIIDFYLKWVHNNIIPKEEREKTYIFSTFFYKRLTTLVRSQQQADKDIKQTAAQKRHARVQNWTKNVNLFEKDFIIIPINEQSHWFLAIICFPKLKGPVTYDTNIPVELQQVKKQRGKKIALQIGNTTITPLSKRDSNPNLLADIVGVNDDHDSDRDEAEGDDEDLASDDSDFESGENNTSSVNTTQSPPSISANITEKQPIKQPLILIFDSLAGAGRSRVVATLRDYLSCEYKLKMANATPHVFNKENMPGHCVKVPQQNNFTDCGLFLLQYVEQFFKDPVADYRLPIKLCNWFDTLTVTRKREDISNLLQQLLNEKYGVGHQIVLPEISFPTLNGELVESHDEYNIEFEEDGMDDETAEEEEELTSGADGDLDVGSDELSQSPVKPTTTAVVPTHGRQIVVKRRMQIVNTNTNNELSPPHSTTMRSSLVKIRKLD